MDFAVIDALEEDDAIDISSLEDAREAAERKAAQRREFAMLMRSIKSMVREET